MFDLSKYLELRSGDFRSKLETMRSHVKLAGGEYGELIARPMTCGGILITDYYLPVYNPGKNDGQMPPIEELHVWQIQERTRYGRQEAKDDQSPSSDNCSGGKDVRGQ